ncbi:DUF305 domain-containing protein [Alkalinema sp. FACHB-956]|uniref:DUF305 domain-containing protein n=1 Tax=Alkalinema sp. FACHB-956 TaxID=2692768 RepID=UPI0016846988|nr:DUF305 domain-containing protein [Alkalinema sp. FACHB-956]MBD2327908.1 DUF305 domain-containing protein [Alkalinema sp. FACHB-956]
MEARKLPWVPVLSALGAAVLTAVGITYGVGMWQLDSTLLHRSEVKLSTEESTRPDKQFIEMILPYEEQLYRIASQAKNNATQSDVQTLATQILDQSPQLSPHKKGSLEEVIKNIKAKYREWYKIEYKAERLGLIDQLPESKSNFTDDRAYLLQMRHNLQVSVKLAYLARDNARNLEIRHWAKGVIDEQAPKISEIQELLSNMSPASSTTPTVIHKATPVTSAPKPTPQPSPSSS